MTGFNGLGAFSERAKYLYFYRLGSAYSDYKESITSLDERLFIKLYLAKEQLFIVKVAFSISREINIRAKKLMGKEWNKMEISRLKIYKKEVIEIYNALSCFNISIRHNQKKRAKQIQKLMKKIDKFIKEI